jgi:hypothetical protein
MMDPISIDVQKAVLTDMLCKLHKLPDPCPTLKELSQLRFVELDPTSTELGKENCPANLIQAINESFLELKSVHKFQYIFRILQAFAVLRTLDREISNTVESGLAKLKRYVRVAPTFK